MQKLLYIGIFLLAALSITAQETDIDPNGYNVFYYPGGKISSEGYMENGKPNGYWKNYHPNGNLRSEGKRTNFELDSTWRFYDSNAMLQREINYKKGLKHGYTLLYKKFEINDSVINVLVSKELYYNGTRNGLSEYYYPESGKLHLKTVYKNDKRHGLAKEYAENGNLISLFEYFNGFLIESSMVNRKNSQNQKTGKWVEFHEAGQIKTEAYYANGKLHGQYKEYSKSGKIIKNLQYRFGELVIAEKEAAKIDAKLKQSYYSNGKLQYEGAFIDSIPVGLHKEYNKDGNISLAKEYDQYGILESQGAMNKEGVKDSVWTFYYPNGEIRSKGAFKDGKRHGKWEFFFQNGKTEQTGKYKNGKTEGEWVWYYPDENILRIENYHRGKLEGLFTEFSTTGDTIQTGEYFDGDKSGRWFYNVGDHTEIGSYELGLKKGVWKHYYNGEKLIYQGSFVDNEPDGLHEWWYISGKPELRGEYIMGTKNGNWYKYHPDGSIFLITKYKNGEIFKINGKRWDKWDKKLKGPEE